MQEEVSAATAMLGLGGFVLLAVSEYDGELEQAIETTTTVQFCRGCGVQARLHGRRLTWVRDLPSGGRPVTLVWVKRIWRCHEPAYAVVTWSEASEAIRPRASLTERARMEAYRRVGRPHSPEHLWRSTGTMCYLPYGPDKLPFRAHASLSSTHRTGTWLADLSCGLAAS